MADNLILLDTSILIDYFRKKDKGKSVFVQLTETYDRFCISAITEYEIRVGLNEAQELFWEELLAQLHIIPFDSAAVHIAKDLMNLLKRQRKQIAIPDLFIASTAISRDLPFATLNKKHFERISDLKLVE